MSQENNTKTQESKYISGILISEEKNQNDCSIIEVNIDLDQQQKVYNKIFSKLAQNVSVPGFRVGKAPKDIIVSKIHDEVMEKAANHLIQKSLSELSLLLEDQEKMLLDVLGIKDLKFKLLENPMKFNVECFAVPYPTIDFSQINIDTSENNKDLKSTKITDKELDEFLQEFVTEIRLQLENIKNKEMKESLDKYKTVQDLDDDFVNNILKLKNVKTLEDFKKDMKLKLTNRALDYNFGELYDEIIEQTLKLANINLSDNFLNYRANIHIESLNKKDLDDYLVSKEITLDDFKKEYTEELYIAKSELITLNLYNKIKKFTIDPAILASIDNSNEDRRFLNDAMEHILSHHTPEELKKDGQKKIMSHLSEIYESALSSKIKYNLLKEFKLDSLLPKENEELEKLEDTNTDTEALDSLDNTKTNKNADIDEVVM